MLCLLGGSSDEEDKNLLALEIAAGCHHDDHDDVLSECDSDCGHEQGEIVCTRQEYYQKLIRHKRHKKKNTPGSLFLLVTKINTMRKYLN